MFPATRIAGARVSTAGTGRGPLRASSATDVVAGRRATCAALALASALVASSASAQEPPPRPASAKLSPYERETVAWICGRRGLVRETAPQGKILDGVEIERLDVLDGREPLPKFVVDTLDALHTTSREPIVRREVLPVVGEPWNDALVEETGRNLRRLFPFSLAVAVPVRGSTPGSVKLLVIVKDIWSLRFSYDFAIGKSGIQSLVLQPAETNLFGLHHSVAATYKQLPLSRELGLSYRIPRFGDSFVGAAGAASVVFNRETGAAEGTNGSVSLSNPLYTARTPWAWSVSGGWATNVVRRYVDGRLGTFDAKATDTKEAIPFEYLQRNLSASVGVTRSFGWRNKSDFSLTFDASRRRYRTSDLSAFSSIAADEFRTRVLPRSDDRVGPSAKIHLYQTKFHRLTDVETLALQEDFRLGYEVWFSAYPVLKPLGSARTFLGLFGAAQYTAPLGNGIVRAGVQTTQEVQGTGTPDASFTAYLRVVTPKLGLGRFVFDSVVIDRYRNYLNRYDYMGGDGRLRGYPTSEFRGKDTAVMNLEFRTRPLEIASLQLGAVAFYDAGNVGDSLGTLRPRQSTGVGLRLLIPQLNRTVLRGDVAFPLGRPLPSGTGPVGFFVAFEQAFAFARVGD